jgi:hypothetical protein
MRNEVGQEAGYL